jgi:Holliday junction resolvase RusA-like endonuclease
MSFYFEIPVTPVPKARARTYTTRQGITRTITPNKTRSFESYIKGWLQLRFDREPFQEPLHFELTFVFEVPKSYSKASRIYCLSDRGRHTKKPDLDNLEKSVLDAAEGVLFYNDSQICKKTSQKKWGEEPLIIMEFSVYE